MAATANSLNKSISVAGREISRIGLGTYYLTADRGYGAPIDRDAAVALVKGALELGVGFIETSSSYGPGIVESILHDALSPYPDSLVILTKVGSERTGAGERRAAGRPDQLRQAADASLVRLGIDAFGVLELEEVDPDVPVADQVGALVDLQAAGKARAIGVCNVDAEQFDAARGAGEIATVEHRYNLTDRRAEAVLVKCQEAGIAFIASAPLDSGQLTKPGGRPIDRPLDNIGWRTRALPSQLAIVWLLQHSPSIVATPSTASLDHLEEAVGAAEFLLGDDDFNTLSNLVKPGTSA